MSLVDWADFSFDREDVDQLAVVGIRPEMRVAQRIDQLHVDAHLVVGFLYAAFEDVSDPELPGDIAQVRGRALEALR